MKTLDAAAAFNVGHTNRLYMGYVMYTLPSPASYYPHFAPLSSKSMNNNSYNNSASANWHVQRQRPGSAPVTKALTDSTTTEGDDSQEPRQATPIHRSTYRLSLLYRWILPCSSNAQTYLGCMKDLQSRDHELRRSVGWKSLLNGLSKECAVTIRFASGALW